MPDGAEGAAPEENRSASSPEELRFSDIRHETPPTLAAGEQKTGFAICFAVAGG